jgi:hypothetical protein
MHVQAWACDRNLKPLDPINLLFDGDVALSDIEGHLRQLQWDRPGAILMWPEAVDLYLPPAPARRQDLQLVRPVLPGVPFGILWRHHVRFWAVNSGFIASGHYEKPHLKRGHLVTSFEDTERMIAEDFEWQRKGGNWRVNPTAHPLNNKGGTAKSAPHNGNATVITHKPGA